MKKLALTLGLPAALLGGLLAVLLGNMARKGSVQVTPPPLRAEVDRGPAVQALAAAVRIRTVSHSDGTVDHEAHAALHQLLVERFPRVHEQLERKVLGDTLLYRWPGADADLAPGLLLAHQDVVPVEDPTVWTHPPFSGAIADGYVWGRGTLDDKHNIIGQLAAAEHLLAAGWAPQRTLYFGFGHDEEVGGQGAKAIAAELEGRGVELEFVLDEGGAVAVGIMAGLDAPVATVGISEKGYASVELRASSEGGHSSMPPPHSALGHVARALVAVENHPLPVRWDGPTGVMLDTVGPEMDVGLRLVMANRWLLGPIVQAKMEAKRSTNATLRTTTAVTMASGSPQDNVLPQEARGVVNFRIAPGDTTESVLAHVRALVGPDVSAELYGQGIASDPAPISRTDGPAWDALRFAIRQTWPDAVVTPYLTIGATDARHLTGLSERVWRFSPVASTSDDLARIHGIDERISEDAVEDLVAFYVRFLRQAGA